ncbi:SusC/RagA family TonB-linked outer membrane protein [Mucilaginibacter ginsenosidivorax]|uniref:SusC/RagA family TonB-linked outer membrane protein n=1 Tax=Mucilaginibacter ginsenosidivorax TaxID=862126 RepID=A0A5B8VWL8_9SPHI|nr:SusC/RagA family TonB-linked outer membrane protein [Mucilaginibacter ginsenosidivorax]QEC74826.1 SusC/RagA family TonB-linked outer membrane protein [Mucilaginibacter ginsenosidivorax]
MEKKIKASGMMLSITISVLFTLMITTDVWAGNVAKVLIKADVGVQTVTGKVIDEKGLPLVGVSVSEKGARNGVLTDVDGNYRIQVSANNAVLIFSYVGYSPKTEPLNGRSTLNVTLEPRANALSEIIVTALGIKRESKKLGYAAENVRVGEITANRSTNFVNSLEGKVAGLDISPPASGPGGSTKIRLRGQSAFQGDNAPLIVLNGLPLSQSPSSTNSYTQSVDLGDNMQQINPDDIESMTILKGATAAALYGSRASNGAIIITTKNGNKNTGIGIEFTSNFTQNQALDFTDFQYEYGQGENNVRPKTQGQAQSSGAWSFGEKFDNAPTYQFDGVQRPYAPEKNRISKFFRRANAWTNTIAFSGGNDKGSFRFSYSNQDAQGIVPNNDYHKKIFNLGLNYNFTPKLSAQIYINYDHENNNNPPVIGIQGTSVTNYMYRYSNSVSLDVLKAAAVDANGNEAPTSRFTTLTNPYWIMNKQFTRQPKDHLLGTASLRYQFFDWLYLQGRVNMEYSASFYEQNVPTGTLANAAAPVGLYNGSYNSNDNTYRALNADFLLGGGHKWGDFSLDATIGGNTFPSSSRGYTVTATNFYVRDFYTLGNGATTTSAYAISKSTVNSLYGTAEFGYKSYLFINVTGRNDWFSVLSPEHNHYFYPSVSGSFVFSEFLKNSPSWLSFGKIRATYANVGSANGIGPYSNSLTFALSQNTFNGFPLGSINNTTTPNQNIKPYSVKEKEIGLELRMFNSRVNLDVAAYDKHTTNQILSVAISNASGYTGTIVNLGELQNRGMEFLLELIPIKKENFTWRSAFNTAINSSKVLTLANGQNQLTLGAGEFFGSIVDQVGLPLNQIQGSTYRRDASGNIILSGGKPVASTSPRLFGSALPKATGGWVNTFSYKKFTLMAHIDYKTGGKILSSSNLNFLREGLSKESLVGRDGGVKFNGVNADGTPNTTAVNAEDFYANYRSQGIIDPFVYKSDFIKLRNVSLSYDFSKMVKAKFIKGLVLSAVCHNVLIIKKYTPNIDPEAISSSGDILTGYEQSSLPTTRTYGFNLNVKF